MKNRFSLFLILLLALAMPASVRGWGYHGHEISGLAAALKSPTEMPGFFHQASKQLSYLNPEPDRWRERAESDLDPAVRAFSPDHYVDLEFVPEGALTTASDRYAFIEALVKSGRKPAEAGFLPYRILELFQRLRMEFRLWRATTDPLRRALIEQRIINDAGILGHYVTDGANPHHTTMHHNGWVGENPKGFSTDNTIHYRFEQVYVQSHVQVNDLLPLVAAARVIAKPREEVIAYLQTSKSHLETLYELEKKEGFGELTKSEEHKKFVQARLAAGSQMLRDLWWTAWVTSEAKPETKPASN
jgi:hypothetical protein